MKRFGWSFHTVKQLVTHNVRINFCPSQGPKYKIQSPWWIWQAGLADSCVGLQKNDLLSVCVHVPGRGRGGSDPLPLRQKNETQREREREGNWEGLHASSTSQACVQPHLGGFEVVSGLVSTLQDCSLLFRNKVIWKNEHKKKEQGFKGPKKKVSSLSLGFSKFEDTHNLDLNSLTVSSQDNNPEPSASLSSTDALVENIKMLL